MHKTPEHPAQPIIRDAHGIVRFRENTIVHHLFNEVQKHKVEDVDSLAKLPFSDEDRRQFAQLVGPLVQGSSEPCIDPRHPMQPLVRDDHGVIRFKKNAIVDYLLEVARLHKVTDLNRLACKPFAQEDWTQFMQLIGYSVSGYGELIELVDPEVVAEADRLADEMCRAG